MSYLLTMILLFIAITIFISKKKAMLLDGLNTEKVKQYKNFATFIMTTVLSLIFIGISQDFRL